MTQKKGPFHVGEDGKVTMEAAAFYIDAAPAGEMRTVFSSDAVEQIRKVVRAEIADAINRLIDEQMAMRKRAIDELD